MLLPTHLTFPLHPHRRHTSAHPFLLSILTFSLAPIPFAHVRDPRSLMPTGPSSHPFPTFPWHPHHPHTSAYPRSLMPTTPSPHPFPTCPISNLSLAPIPSAHVRASTLAHAHWSFSPPFPIFSVAPTLSAHVRSSQVALCAVRRLNENPSIEDAFGKTVGLLEGKRCLK